MDYILSIKYLLLAIKYVLPAIKKGRSEKLMY